MRIEMPEFANAFPNLSEAVTLANRLFQGDGDFFTQVGAIPQFALSEHAATRQPVTGAEIVPLLSQQIDVMVVTYKPWYVCSKATAKTILGEKVIQLNARKLQRSIDELVATLVHECVHVVDTVPGMSFGHGNNFANGKKLTAPYRIGKIAQDLVPGLQAH